MCNYCVYIMCVCVCVCVCASVLFVQYVPRIGSSTSTQLELDLRVVVIHPPRELKSIVKNLAIVKVLSNASGKSRILYVCVCVCVCVCV